MESEVPKGLPGSEAVAPHEEDKDRGPDDLAGLDQGIVQQRVDPAFRVEGDRVEGPTEGRIQHDPRALPESVDEVMGAHTEGDESQAPEARRETEGGEREQEDEGVRPDAPFEAEDVAERLVDDGRQGRRKQKKGKKK